MSGATGTPSLETPPNPEPTPTPTPTPEGKTAEEIAAEAEAARVAALTPEEKAEEERVAKLTPEERAAEETAKAEREAAMKAPVTVEAIKLPEGVELPEGGLDPFLTIVNDASLTPTERSQKLIDLHVEALKSASEAGSKAWEETQEEWQTKAKADPEFGGAKLPATLATIGKLVEQFGDDETRQAFDLTGAGNHPAIIKFLAKVGAKLTEGGPVTGAPATTEVDRARRLYPSMNA